MTGDLAPTPRLRFVERDAQLDDAAIALGAKPKRLRILQQFWQQDVPSYMRADEGEWRDVPLEAE